MNKKIIASLLIAATAFVSSIASAVTYTNSVASGTDAQGANAQVVIGGSAVRANDLILSFAGTPELAAGDEIVVRLPTGFNFDGEPEYLVERSGGVTATTGLTLEDGTEFGDPTLDNPGITLDDTDGDGSMDRALVTVSSEDTAGDTLTISINVTASSAVTAGTGKLASVIVAGNLAVTQEIADAVASLSTPVSSAATGQAKVDQNLNEAADTSGADFIVTIPAGTAGGTSLTLTPNSGIQWSTNGSTITWTVHTPGFAVDVLTPTSATNVVGPVSATSAVTLKTNWASTATNDSAIQVAFDVSELNSLAGATGLRGLAVGGAAVGNAQLVEVLANGSEATLATGAKATTIVAGSSAPQTLPTIDVEENFDTDLGGSFTITAGTGLTFVSGGSISATGITGTISVNATSTVITVTVNAPNGASDTLTISGITGIAAGTADGDLTVEVDSTTAAAPFGPKDDVLTVASAVPVGVVEVSLSGKANDVGADAFAATSVIDLNETTYGALSTAAETQVQDAFFRITPSANANLTAVTTSTSGYAAGTSPTIDVTCVAETGVTTGAYLCEVQSESTAVVPTTSTVSVSVSYTTDKASVGDTVDITLDGNAEVAGTVTVANVKIATTASVTSAIPDLTPGDDTAKTLATLKISENFTGAITNGGSLRLVAPTGVAFQDAASVQAQTDIGTATITATFNPNDTLVLDVSATTSITVIAKAVVADGLSGKITVDIFDGDIDGLNPAGVTEEEVILLYAGELDALSGGDDGDVNVGFSIENAVTGGLAPYTVTGGSTFASATIDGSTVTTKGLANGVGTITVTDDLGATDTFDVTVATGAAQPDAEKASKTLSGADAPAGSGFTAGASSDGGTTYATEFTTTDDVTIVATVDVGTADQGSDGGIHVALLSVTDAGTLLSYLDEDENFVEWDTSAEPLPGAVIIAEPLGASYTVTVFSGNLAAGTYRIALAYSVGVTEVVYTGKAITITVTE